MKFSCTVSPDSTETPETAYFSPYSLEEALNNSGAQFKKDAASVSIFKVSGGRKAD